MSRLAEEIKKLQKETKNEFLKLEDGQTAVANLDLKMAPSIGRDLTKYKDKVFKAARFPVTEVNTGQDKMLGLALTWAANLIDVVEYNKQNGVEISRHGKDTN